MNLEFAKNRLPMWSRLTAAFAACLIFALGLFSVSPAAHAWLHARDGGSAAHSTSPSQPGPATDDGCAIVLFSSGVLAAVIAFLVAGAFRRTVSFSFRYVAALYRATPRYWLPPLCGPPLN